MYDGNRVHIHTGRYPRGIDVSNFKCKFEYLVPEERFSGGGGTNLAAICFLPLFIFPGSCGHRFQQSEDTQKS
jgi:hypothetical protein